MKKILSLASFILFSMGMNAQSCQQVLESAQKANNYFMAKYDDPTKATFVKKIRPSSLWTRAVYYEGLMDLYSIDNNQAYIDYALRWADFHQWTPRNGVKTTDADDQCCGQTYYLLLPHTSKKDAMDKLLQADTTIGHGLTLYKWQCLSTLWLISILEIENISTMLWSHIDGVVMFVVEDCTIPREDFGGEIKTMYHLIRSRMATTAIGAAAMVGFMLHSYV